ncbi:chemotaxis protein CheW [Niveibacterium sp. 24ML]|uniref:chemotaxis protein CheW n=1 Tax=Niveibacterium sp. 24ML TaxID=2985512 RepID=UPI00226F9E07|nr:chemotaxis protein CheW [Niveibacterium sp. 24ML]MCX9154737.1 chemotaxis protein CheW [Niveibacterium sp. 24ML]
MSALTQTAPARLQAGESGETSRQYLAFMLGGELYAVEILRIKEIIEYGALTTVPMMPSFVRGVINLRGSVLPVIDLQARFGRAPTQVAKRTCIVIVEIHSDAEDAASQSQTIGVMVDAVNEVVEINANQIEPPPSFGVKIRPDFIAGMGKLGKQFVILLELDKVLSVDEMASLAVQSASAPAAEQALLERNAGD